MYRNFSTDNAINMIPADSQGEKSSKKNVQELKMTIS